MPFKKHDADITWNSRILSNFIVLRGFSFVLITKTATQLEAGSVSYFGEILTSYFCVKARHDCPTTTCFQFCENSRCHLCVLRDESINGVTFLSRGELLANCRFSAFL